MSQLSLFETDETDETKPMVMTSPRTIYRRTDPATSKRAAVRVIDGLSDLEQMFVDALQKFDYPPTAQEVADRAVAIDDVATIRAAISKRESVRKRAVELTREKRDKNGELIRPAVIRVAGERECTMTGSEASTYELI